MKRIKRLDLLAKRIRERSRTRKKRKSGEGKAHCRTIKRGGNGKIMLPSECMDDTGGIASKITLILRDDGLIKGGGPRRKKYTIMLKYDPKCHDVVSLSSECTNIGNVEDSLHDLAKAASGAWTT